MAVVWLPFSLAAVILWLGESSDQCNTVDKPAPLIKTGTGPALLLVGGLGPGDNRLTSVEQYSTREGDICSLPDLPEGRNGSSVDIMLGMVIICGGYGSTNTWTTCISWEPGAGEWRQFYNLWAGRWYHSSWVTERGLMLLGGYDSFTAELVPLRPDQSPGTFSLPQAVRDACTFSPTSSHLVITGGDNTMDKAYTINSYLTLQNELPSLNHGRRNHGCSYYTASEGQSPTFIVTGGYDGSKSRLDSTELLTPGSSSWTLITNSLPTARYNLRVGRLDNKILATGGYEGRYLDEILVFNVDTKKWELTGRMKKARAYHGLPVASTSFCG